MQEKSLRMFVIYHGAFPSPKAAALFAAKNCEAFAYQGVAVTLLTPRRIGGVMDDPFEYYHIKKNFRVVFLPTIDLFWFPIPEKISFLISYAAFSLISLIFLFFRAGRNNVIYSNESLPLFLVSFFFHKTFYEMHDFPESKHLFFAWFVMRMRWILIHNKWKADRFSKVFRVPTARVICQPNAVDIGAFDISLTRDEARRQLHLPQNRRMVVYTGSLFRWKGVDTLAEASRYLPDNALIAFVGGAPEEVSRFRELYGSDAKLMIVGYRPHQEIPIWQRAADVLVLPNTATQDISKFYTSPMKLFEYMASRRPIVASDIPSMREILNDTNAVLVEPDDPSALAAGIKRAYEKTNDSKNRVEQAFADVGAHTWERRAENIIHFIQTL